MVSELSARLNYSSGSGSGYSSSGSDGTPSSADLPQTTTRGKKRDFGSSQGGGSSGNGESSGYMADLSALASTAESALSRESPSFPPSIELLFRNAKKAGRTVSQSGHSSDAKSSTNESDDRTNPCAKRHKSISIAEMNYRVRTVRQDMEKGGLLYQRHGARRPLIFPPKSFVDMSTVSLVVSEKGSKAPFSLPGIQDSCLGYVDCPLQLASLIEATSSHYNPKVNEPLPAAFSQAVNNLRRREAEILEEAEKESSSDGDSESTMSSFTVSDGGAAQPSRPAIGVVAAIEEKRALSPASHSVLPISEALSISRHPRIIALAQAPFKVVQVNAAFLRLVNSTSTSEFLGKPLGDLTVDGSVIAAMQESLASLHAVVVPGDQHFHKTKDRHHKTTVLPVGTPGQDVKVTHFAVKLRLRSSHDDRSMSCASSVSSTATTYSNCKADNTPVFAMG